VIEQEGAAQALSRFFELDDMMNGLQERLK